MTHFVRLFVNNKHQLSESEVPYNAVLESQDNLVYEFQFDQALTEAQSDAYADTLSEYLLENGIEDFDIEISISEESIAEMTNQVDKMITNNWHKNVRPILESHPGTYYMGAYVYSKEAEKAIYEHKQYKTLMLEDELTCEGDEFYETFGDLWYDENGLYEAEYQGRKVKLGKPTRGDVKKFKVYVKNPKGNVVKVNFGDPNMKIKKSNPARRKSFRARHNCDNPGPRHKARYWSCRKW